MTAACSTCPATASRSPAWMAASAASRCEATAAALRASVHVPLPALLAHYQGGDVASALAETHKPADAMIDDLLWWTSALKRARAA